MKRYIPFIVILLAVIGVVIVTSLEPAPVQTVVEPPIVQQKPKSKYEVGPPEPAELLELVNKERKRVGVAPLVTDDALNRSAQWKADDIVENSYFSHTSSNGKEGYTKVLEVTDRCIYASENIQFTSDGTSQDAFNWWKQSKSHYDAMIDPKYSLTGFGVSFDKVIKGSEVDSTLKSTQGDAEDSYISVQHFCQLQ